MNMGVKMTTDARHSSSGRGYRLGRVTQREQIWLDALDDSDLDLSNCFTARQAMYAIASVPLRKSGRVRKIVPQLMHMNKILKKCGRFDWGKEHGKTSNLFILKEEYL